MTTFELPAEYAGAFQALAKETGRSTDNLLREAMAKFLEDMEDREDAEEADRLYREFKESGEQGIPWEQVKAEMDIKHGL